jgi:hypothetical protein
MGSSSATPSVLPSARDPRWLWLGHTLPAAIIVTLYLSAFALVGTLLDADTIMRWRLGGGLLGTTHLTFLLLALHWHRNAQVVPVWAALLSLALHTALAAFVLFASDDLLPRAVPAWMFPPELFRLSMALPLIPALQALYILVQASLKRDDSIAHTMMYVVLIPVAWYLLFTLFSNVPFARWLESSLAVIGTLTLVLFLFHLMKLITQLARRSRARWSINELFWRIPLALVLPLLGLILHTYSFGDPFGGGPLGDFSHPLFFILAVFNGVLVCAPLPEDKSLRAGLFFLRGIGLSYVLYFALVFLPFLPFAIVLVLFFGLGLLMLIPLALLLLQLGDVVRDAAWLKAQGMGARKWLLFAAGMLLLPIVLTGLFMRDARVLEQTLVYVYAPDPSRSIDAPSPSAIERVTKAGRRHKTRVSNDFGVNGVPLISGWYDRIVFKGLTLSDDKLDLLEAVFLDKPDASSSVPRRRWTSTFRPPTGSVHLDTIATRSTLDPATNTWSTWVDLSLTNDATWQAEYATTFELPKGAFIRDHYLMIGDRRAQGILAERKSASWIYRQITTITRQDPSLLRYIAPDRIELRVFPFAPDERRSTGFEIIAKEPFILRIDSAQAWVGEPARPLTTPVLYSTDGTGVLVPAHVKESLPSIVPKTTLWCILDQSARSDTATEALISALDNTLATGLPSATQLRFVLANSAAQEVEATAWREAYRTSPKHGGMLLDRAFDLALSHHRKVRNERAVFLVVTADAQQFITTERIPYALAALGLPVEWLVLTPGQGVSRHGQSGRIGTEGIALEPFLNTSMKAWPDAHATQALLPDDGASSMVLLERAHAGTSSKNSMTQGLDLFMLHGLNALEPHRTLDEEHGDARRSLAAGLLSPATAFICLETEAQEIALRRKQEQVLNGSSLMDAGEELRSMSEPGDLLLVVMLILVLLWTWRRSGLRAYSR